MADYIANPKVYGDAEHYGWTTDEEEDIPQPLPNLFTPTEIEAFKMIELARIQNKYLIEENILLKDHIAGLKGIIRKLEELLRSMCDYPPSSSPPPPPTTKEI